MRANHDKGFSLIEILITLTIMVTLLMFLAVNLRSSQAKARDEERKIDSANLARGLENFYSQGDSVTSTPAGSYPGINDIATAETGNRMQKNYLPGTPTASFSQPGSTNIADFYFDATHPDGELSDAYALGKLAGAPYLYQPLTRTNLQCWDAVGAGAHKVCTKFVLYYWSEATNTAKKIRSKNQ